MVRETVVSGDDGKPDKRWDDQLRPQRFSEVVGQRDVVQRLEIALNAARKRDEPLGHILFDGPPGLGKTTLATVLAKERDARLAIMSGPALTAPKDLMPMLTNASEGSVLFIDEIHRLPPAVEEFLYPVMEDFRADFVLGDGIKARTINYRLPRFTVIGATTRSGSLSAPLRDRFVSREHLDFYALDELAEIVRRNAGRLRTPITDGAALELARRSRGTPRVANNRLRWARDYVTSEADGRITLERAREALAMQGIDTAGLDSMDRRYLETLTRVFDGGPAGVEAVAHTMNIATDTLSDEVEPFLLRRGFVIRTPRGRVVTDEGWAHLGLPRTKEDGDQRPLFE